MTAAGTSLRRERQDIVPAAQVVFRRDIVPHDPLSICRARRLGCQRKSFAGRRCGGGWPVRGRRRSPERWDVPAAGSASGWLVMVRRAARTLGQLAALVRLILHRLGHLTIWWTRSWPLRAAGREPPGPVRVVGDPVGTAPARRHTDPTVTRHRAAAGAGRGEPPAAPRVPLRLQRVPYPAPAVIEPGTLHQIDLVGPRHLFGGVSRGSSSTERRPSRTHPC